MSDTNEPASATARPPSWDRPANARPRKVTPGLTWPVVAVACAVACIGSASAIWWLDKAANFRALGSGVAGGLGAVVLILSLAIAGLVWTLLHFGFTRRRAPGQGTAHLSFLSGSSLLGGIAVAVFLMAQLSGVDAVIGPIMDAHATRVTARDDRLIDDLSAALDAENGLFRARLQNPSRLGEVRDGVRRARTALETHRRDIDAMQADVLQRIGASDLTEVQRLPAEARIRGSFAQSDRARGRFLSTYLAILDHMDGQIDLLEGSRGHWRMQPDGVIVFDRYDDRMIFMDYERAIGNLRADLQAEGAEVDAVIAQTS